MPHELLRAAAGGVKVVGGRGVVRRGEVLQHEVVVVAVPTCVAKQAHSDFGQAFPSDR